jgi:membrane protein YdbS with pleckstrin-like domain
MTNLKHALLAIGWTLLSGGAVALANVIPKPYLPTLAVAILAVLAVVAVVVFILRVRRRNRRR